MTAPILLSALLGVGLLLVVIGQPLGRPRPDLASRLWALSAQGRIAIDERAAARGPLFQSAALERLLRPLLDDVGGLFGRLLARVGAETGDLDQRLNLTWPGLTAAQFRGQQLATGLIAFAAFPAMNLLDVHPFGPWPLWLWLAGGFVGCAVPSWILDHRLQQRRRSVLMELPAVLDLLAIGASAGLSPEQALVEVGRRFRGTVAAALRAVARDAGLGIADYASGLQSLAAHEGVPELRSLADAWRLAQQQGLPLGPAMLALAETVRDRKRARLLEEGGKGSIRMLFPIALFIFPVFLVVLLYPAGVVLLGLGK